MGSKPAARLGSYVMGSLDSGDLLLVLYETQRRHWKKEDVIDGEII